MSFSVHPNAQAAYDAKADELLALATERFTAAERTGNPFLALNGIPVSVEVVWESYQDIDIKTAVIFELDGKAVRIEGDDFLPIIHLAEQLQRRPELSEVVSVEAVLDVLISWFRQRLLSETGAGFVDFLLGWIEQNVSEQTIIFPIFEVRFDGTLSVHGVEIRQLEPSEIDEWYEAPMSDPEWRKSAEEDRDYWKPRIGGRAAAFVKVTAEPKHAHAVAYEKVDAVLSLLRSFSPAMLIPARRSYCTVYGMEATQERTAFSRRESGWIGVSHPMLAGQTTWSLNEDALRELASYGLLKTLELLELEQPTEFQQDILRAIMLYSRAALEPRIESKLLYIVAAIDSLLLVDSQEPILSSISRRFAYTVGRNLEERQQVQKRFKSAYGARSGFVHHGVGIDDHQLAEAFMRDAWNFFRKLAFEGAKHRSRQAYIQAMEDEMLSGPGNRTE